VIPPTYRYGRLRLIAALASIFVRSSIAEPAPVTEHELKAALTYKLTKYVEWPSSAFADSRTPFVMCVAGDDSVARAFRSLESKPLHGRQVSVRKVASDVLDLRRCHAVYFARTHRLDVGYAIETLSGAAVLTIGESSSFTASDGMVTLLTGTGRVQFVVNLAASKQAQLNISSQILQLASVVGVRSP
jgi:hypothetical protein